VGRFVAWGACGVRCAVFGVRGRMGEGEKGRLGES